MLGRATKHVAPGVVRHTCCYCGKTHPRGSKAYDAVGVRCAKREGCTLRPVKANLVKPAGACVGCGAKTRRGVRRCTDPLKCYTRVVKRLVVDERSADWERTEYARAFSIAGREQARAFVDAANERAEAAEAGLAPAAAELALAA